MLVSLLGDILVFNQSCERPHLKSQGNKWCGIEYRRQTKRPKPTYSNIKHDVKSLKRLDKQQISRNDNKKCEDAAGVDWV